MLSKMQRIWLWIFGAIKKSEGDSEGDGNKNSDHKNDKDNKKKTHENKDYK